MPRLRPLSRDEAADEVKSLYDSNVRAFGLVLNTTGVYAYRPAIQLGAKALGDAIAKSEFISAKLRSLINVRIASQVGCGF